MNMATLNMAAITSKTEVATAVVPPAEWLTARKELLRKEKEFTRLRDEFRRAGRWTQPAGARAAAGKSGEEIRFRRNQRQGDARRSVRRTEPADRLSLHVWSGMERGVPELLVPGRYLRRCCRASGAARCEFRGDFPCDAAGDRGIQEAHGMAVQMGLLVRERVQL